MGRSLFIFRIRGETFFGDWPRPSIESGLLDWGFEKITLGVSSTLLLGPGAARVVGRVVAPPRKLLFNVVLATVKNLLRPPPLIITFKSGFPTVVETSDGNANYLVGLEVP